MINNKIKNKKMENYGKVIMPTDINKQCSDIEFQWLQSQRQYLDTLNGEFLLGEFS